MANSKIVVADSSVRCFFTAPPARTGRRQRHDTHESLERRPTRDSGRDSGPRGGCTGYRYDF
eukprot:7389563-Prymnesium_polylepis.1